MAYRVKEEALDLHPQLFTQVNGKRVTLHGKEEKVQVPATKTKPAREIVVPMATQAELAILCKEGNPFIEEYDKKEEKA